MLLKRSGRGHETEGVDGTKPGQCAVECPACPHPGQNMPLDWNEIPECDQYVLLLSTLLSLIFCQVEVSAYPHRRRQFPYEEQGPKREGYAGPW
jgi:hypothetical protein